MNISGGTIGIDLGTCNTQIYAGRQGVVYNEPTLVVVDANRRGNILAIGEDAQEMLSHGTSGMVAVRPIKEGIISDYDTTKMLIKYSVRRGIGSSYLIKPKIFISCPGCITDIDKRALCQAAREATGQKNIRLIEKSFLSAVGCGLPVFDITGQMIVDIGGGTTDVAVISLGGIVVRHSVRVGGSLMDEALIGYIKRKYNILIGQRTAEKVKLVLGSAQELNEVRTERVRGIYIPSGLSEQTEITSAEVYEAIKSPCLAIAEAIKWVLERTPPDLIVDIMEQGISLTGGGSMLFGMDQFISNQLGVAVRKTKNSTEYTVLGLGSVIDNFEKLNEQGMNGFIIQ